jgi:methionyl-tRNA formyltransferase
MRVLILASSLTGTAPLCLRELVRDPAISIATIVYSRGQVQNRFRHWRRKLRKVVTIGPLGAVNGVRMRSWFGTRVEDRLKVERLDVLAGRHGIPFQETPAVNCARTAELFRLADAELGVSLGNPYIGEAIFSIPRCGMINLHGEILPQFQGAQSVIWAIHEGSRRTGFTIHQIDRHIDTGSILFQETMPIEFKDNLAETVTHNCVRISEAAAAALPDVIRNYHQLAASSTPQNNGRTFTTPTFSQYLRMRKQHGILAAQVDPNCVR